MLSNKGKSFQGSIVLGKGFILTPEEALSLIDKDPRNKEVLFPYLNGDDLNNSPTQEPSRWVINFFDWSEEKARSYPDCFDIVERLVKPERLIQKDKGGKEKWWQFLRPRKELYATISELDQVMVITRVSKYVVTTFVDSSYIFMDKIVVLSYEQKDVFSVLQSTIFDSWAWKYSSTLGANTINFSPNDCFENFPFPLSTESLEKIGALYYNSRKELMKKSQLGLTKIYNLFHSENISQNANISKLTFLQKHLEKANCCLKIEEIVSNIQNLRNLHIQLDQTIINSYGWKDIVLTHDFYEIDYLPKNDRVRFTMHPTARKEILKRLLILNLHRYNEESKSDTFDKNISKKRSKSTHKASNIMLFPED
ncbi:type IIL restriction-modification enzyme MmeI [Flavobacterium sp. WV_118_3]|uniref:type IIL restriction-modification enzyme MmeI n=1 Tax=Flavobacterium sp. WV_118_3 TaxID=3151764 RepID=UPI00321BDD4A